MKKNILYKTIKTNNVLIVIILVIAFLIVFASTSFYTTYKNAVTKTLNAYYSNQISVMKVENYQTVPIDSSIIMEIDNVTDAYQKVGDESYGYLDKNMEKVVILRGINEYNLKKYYKYDKTLNDFEVLCPANFYSNDINVNHMISRFDLFNIKKGDSLDIYYLEIKPGNRSGTISSEPVKVNVVDTFNGGIIENDYNVCYANHKTVEHFNLLTYPNYNDNSVIVYTENKDSKMEVIETINKMGYGASDVIEEPDISVLSNTVNFIYIFTFIISIIISIIVCLKNVHDSKVIYKKYQIFGYNKEELEKIYNYNILHVIKNALITIIISLLIIFIVLSIGIYIFPYLLYGLPIKVDFIKILIFLFVILGLIVLILKTNMKRIIREE